MLHVGFSEVFREEAQKNQDVMLIIQSWGGGGRGQSAGI